MRVRDHIALSTTGAALLHRRLDRGGLGFWAGSVLVDVDHYLWFGLRERRWSPLAAMRFFNEAHPPQHAATRALHNPIAPLSLVLLGLRRPALLPVALGIVLHLGLDACHEARMHAATTVALRRDSFSCQACGRQAADVSTHLRRQPWLLPSYRPQNLVSLCGPCHETAHADGRQAGSWS
jgi:hypothetical protein